MRICFDAVAAANIPTDAELVAGYVDGRLSEWSLQDWARFPNATLVHIAVLASTNAGEVLDVEQGDATPAEAPGWVLMRRASGADPTVYCGASVWDAVWNAFVAAGVAQPHYWLADPSAGGVIFPGSGVVARQFTSPGPVDVSAVADYWPGVDPPLSAPLTVVDCELIAEATWLPGAPGTGGIEQRPMPRLLNPSRRRIELVIP